MVLKRVTHLKDLIDEVLIVLFLGHEVDDPSHVTVSRVGTGTACRRSITRGQGVHTRIAERKHIGLFKGIEHRRGQGGGRRPSFPILGTTTDK